MISRKTVLVLPVRFSFESRAVQTTTRELSAEGVFVRCLEPPPAGAQVELKIYLPGLAQSADFVGLVREVSSKPGEGGFWADFVSAPMQAHESLVQVLSGSAMPPRPAPALVPVPLASLYRQVHVSHPPAAAATAARPAAAEGPRGEAAKVPAAARKRSQFPIRERRGLSSKSGSVKN